MTPDRSRGAATQDFPPICSGKQLPRETSSHPLPSCVLQCKYLDRRSDSNASVGSPEGRGYRATRPHNLLRKVVAASDVPTQQSGGVRLTCAHQCTLMRGKILPLPLSRFVCRPPRIISFSPRWQRCPHRRGGQRLAMRDCFAPGPMRQYARCKHLTGKWGQRTLQPGFRAVTAQPKNG